MEDYKISIAEEPNHVEDAVMKISNLYVSEEPKAETQTCGKDKD
jgi:hypothetical protein